MKQIPGEKIKKDFEEMKREENMKIANLPLRKKIKLFEELVDFVFQFYIAGRNYVKRNSPESK